VLWVARDRDEEVRLAKAMDHRAITLRKSSAIRRREPCSVLGTTTRCPMRSGSAPRRSAAVSWSNSSARSFFCASFVLSHVVRLSVARVCGGDVLLKELAGTKEVLVGHIAAVGRAQRHAAARVAVGHRHDQLAHLDGQHDAAALRVAHNDLERRRWLLRVRAVRIRHLVRRGA
jgi:hypothetical protein